jgi:hypothetical protein
MWTYFYGQYGNLSQDGNFERCLQAMLRYSHVRFLDPDPDRIRREFYLGPRTYPSLFALFQEHHAEREGKTRWGDQTGLVERYSDQIFSAYPGAKIIHMIRDPRDRYEASLALWPSGRMRVGGATGRWLYSMNLAKRNLCKYPGGYMVVRFESLIREPEPTLRQVCTFLEEKFNPGMIDMEGAPEQRNKMIQRAKQAPNTGPLSEEFIGRYRQVMSVAEIAFMQSLAGRKMLAWDYALDPICFSIRETFRYLTVDFPLNLGRMALWLGIEAIQHRFPTRFGRKPDRRTIRRDKSQKGVRLETH